MSGRKKKVITEWDNWDWDHLSVAAVGNVTFQGLLLYRMWTVVKDIVFRRKEDSKLRSQVFTKIISKYNRSIKKKDDETWDFF